MMFHRIRAGWRGTMVGAALGVVVVLRFLIVFLQSSGTDRGEQFAVWLYVIGVLGFPVNAPLHYYVAPPQNAFLFGVFVGGFVLAMIFQLSLAGFLIDGAIRLLFRKADA